MQKDKQIEVKLLSDRLKKVSVLSNLYNTEGGKLLVTNLLKDILMDVDTLCIKHRTLTMQEFIGICSDMKSKMDLAQVLAHSKKNELQAREEMKNLIISIEEEEKNNEVILP